MTDRLLTAEEIIIDVCADCLQEEIWKDEDCKVCQRNMKALARILTEAHQKEIEGLRQQIKDSFMKHLREYRDRGLSISQAIDILGGRPN